MYPKTRTTRALARPLATSAGALGVALALTVAVSPTAGAAGGAYVALGDSYSAGVGTKAKVDDCYRSAYGYPKLLATKYSLTLNYQACSGATTGSVTSNQLSALGAGTNYVTMTIGGNDVGFADVLTECAQPGWMSDCNGKIADGRAILTNDLPGRYDTLFGSVKSKAPNAKVVIGGYPKIFNGEDCNALTFFSPDEESKLNQSVVDINALSKKKATARGFSFVDPVASFTGHAVCDSTEWINGLSNPIEESYHPNRPGNVGYAKLFGPALTGTAYRAVTATSSTPARPTVRAQASAVQKMNIASPANLAKAKAAGIDPNRIRALNSQLASSDSATVQAALRDLRAIDAQYSAGRFGA